ncbi:MAG: hypothetical protein EON54_02945 [Alcaligenaceae bacterium]|nr:MAG: hypothetical protein EON54_02945 [Alcaligenaceae bacterium]
MATKILVSIIITIARAVQDDQFGEVQALTRQLYLHDGNFQGRAMTVERGAATVVTDSQDILRGALLQLMVESVLAAE